MQIIIFILLLTGLLVQAESIFAKESFRSELLSGSKSSFKHWNLKHSEITGHSHYSHLEVTKDGKTFIVEKNENTKPDGEVFTRKTLWFDADSGVPKWYEEEDLRKDFRIINTYSGTWIAFFRQRIIRLHFFCRCWRWNLKKRVFRVP